MLKQILIASSNLGKIREIRFVLQDLPLQILTVADFAALSNFEVEETGQTFSENALLKARSYARVVDLPTIGDDSGLEVAALDGFPGVHSNRWFTGSTEARNQALLAKLKTAIDRSARFVGVVAFFDPRTEATRTFEGVIEGQIATSQRGDKLAGFGYDPIFIPKGYEQTFSQLGAAKKNQISHRRKALGLLRDMILTEYGLS